MKYLIQGGESAARFDALLKFTKISSSDILAALHDYLVRGFSDSAAAAMNGVPLPNFNRALNALNNVAENVEAIKVLDWNHLTDKRHRSAFEKGYFEGWKHRAGTAIPAGESSESVGKRLAVEIAEVFYG